LVATLVRVSNLARTRSLAAALGGVDALVFPAGIGEHAAQIRQRACDAAAWLGVELDVAGNRADGPRSPEKAARCPRG
jgi:acetate kinase